MYSLSKIQITLLQACQVARFKTEIFGLQYPNHNSLYNLGCHLSLKAEQLSHLVLCKLQYQEEDYLT